MIRKLCIGGLAIAGFALLLGGLNSWRQSRQISAVADRFLHAQQTGDAQQARAALHPDVQATWAERIPEDWHAFPQLRYQLGRPEIHGSQATVHAWLDYDGTRLAPQIHLQRDAQSGWRITNIERLPALGPDPNEQLAHELEEKLRTHRLATLPDDPTTSRQ